MVKAKNIPTPLFKISPPSFDPTHPFILKISQPPSSEKIRVNLKPPFFKGGVPTMGPLFFQLFNVSSLERLLFLVNIEKMFAVPA